LNDKYKKGICNLGGMNTEGSFRKNMLKLVLQVTLLLSMLTLSGNSFASPANPFGTSTTEILSISRRQKRGILFSSFIARQKASVQAFVQYAVYDLLFACATALQVKMIFNTRVLLAVNSLQRNKTLPYAPRYNLGDLVSLSKG
jgi:hypothetical protein